MKSFASLAIGLFVLGLIIAGFAYLLGPQSLRDAFHNGQSPVGQLSPSHSVTTPGQPTTEEAGTQSNRAGSPSDQGQRAPSSTTDH